MSIVCQINLSQKKMPAVQLQVQTLPNATHPISKIQPLNKVAVTFEPLMKFLCLSRFRLYNLCNLV